MIYDDDAAGNGRSPTVSVILPTYQRRELVKRAVASVLSQTYRDFELIVVDDGSTDSTAEALAPLGSRLRYVWQQNRGVAAARNAGLRLARGSIVAFIDSDDCWLPDHLAIVTAVLAREPEAVLVSTAPRHVIGGRADPAKARLWQPLPVLFFANPVGAIIAVAARRDALEAAGYFDERLPVHEDGELWVRLAFQGSFAFLRRRTVVRTYTAGSLKEAGRRRGLYLHVFEVRARRALEQARSRPERPALTRQAEGGLRFVAALQALESHDDRAVQTALEEACRLLPDLSREPDLVEERMRFLPSSHESRERLRHLVTAARLWPDPRSDTALFLRLCAVAAAVRQGSLGKARELLTSWPLRPTPRFVLRGTPAILRRVRRDIYRRRHHDGHRVDLEPVLASAGGGLSPLASLRVATAKSARPRK
jgi:hypothetical protein